MALREPYGEGDEVKHQDRSFHSSDAKDCFWCAYSSDRLPGLPDRQSFKTCLAGQSNGEFGLNTHGADPTAYGQELAAQLEQGALDANQKSEEIHGPCVIEDPVRLRLI